MLLAARDSERRSVPWPRTWRRCCPSATCCAQAQPHPDLRPGSICCVSEAGWDCVDRAALERVQRSAHARCRPIRVAPAHDVRSAPDLITTVPARCWRWPFRIASVSAVTAGGPLPAGERPRRGVCAAQLAGARTVHRGGGARMIANAKRASIWQRPVARRARADCSPTGSSTEEQLRLGSRAKRCSSRAYTAPRGAGARATTRRASARMRRPLGAMLAGVASTGTRCAALGWREPDVAGPHGVRAHARARRSAQAGPPATMRRCWRTWSNGCRAWLNGVTRREHLAAHCR